MRHLTALLTAAAVALTACDDPASSGETPQEASRPSSTPSAAPPRAEAAVAPRAETAPAPTGQPDAAPHANMAMELVARARGAQRDFGAHTRTRVVGGVFLLVEASGSTPLFDRADELLQRALPALFNGPFTTHPTSPVSILFFSAKPGYDAYCLAHYGAASSGDLALYHRTTRDIVVDASGGAGFLPTLTHEVVHPIMEADFPGAPLWLSEAVASLFEAPLFAKDGSIHGERRNWRHATILNALASPTEKQNVRFDALFGMDAMQFRAWSAATKTVDKHQNLLNAAIARAFAAWLDDQGKLWAFYHAWRDGFASDPKGDKAFLTVMGKTPEAAIDAWLTWVR